MFALTTLLIDTAGNFVVERGALFQAPVELRTQERLRKYASLARSGWTVDDWGYSLYGRYLPSGQLVVFPALYLEGQPKPKVKVKALPTRFTKIQIEEFSSAIYSFAQQEALRVQKSLTMLIHDLRSLSATILHSNNEARMFLHKDLHEAEVRIGNVEAAQGILRMRIDAFDLVGNPNAILPKRDVPIYRKVDKVVRFFKCSASLENKQIFLSGLSHRLIHGPDVFELVPFSIIDNAVKYSPKGSAIHVSVTEEERTRITVTSLGPRIKKAEERAIFGNGVRGASAVETGLPGTGVGLHLVSRIMADFFKGEIWVQQSQTANNVDQQEFFETTFTVDVPSFSEKRW